MARTRGAASRDAGSLYAKTRSIVVAAGRRLGDRDDARCAVAVSALLCAFELVFCVAIVRVVPYTEIDWRAYMDEVGGFLRGERDYTKLEGDTGPLVYPAGFVYLYAILKKHILGCADDDACADALVLADELRRDLASGTRPEGTWIAADSHFHLEL